MLAALVFLASVAYVPGLTGAAINTNWVVLSLLPLFLFHRIPMTPAHWFGLAFVGYASATLFWTQYPLDAIEELWHLAILACAFCLGSIRSDLRGIFIALGLGLTVSIVVTIVQDIWQLAIPGINGGLLFNPNVQAETALIVLLGVIVYRVWWLVPTLILAWLYHPSRASLVAACVVLIYLIRWWPSYFLLGLILIAGVFYGGSASMQVRFEFWAYALNHLSIFGSGIGSFAAETNNHAHNEFIQALFEFGVGSILLWACLIWAWNPKNDLNILLVGIGALSCATFPLHLPLTAFMASLIAGNLASRAPLPRLDGAGWGSSLLAWLDREESQAAEGRRLDVSVQSCNPQRTVAMGTGE